MSAYRNTATVLGPSTCLILVGAALLWMLRWDGESSARIALGRQLYGAYCASCHGAGFQGEPDWQSPKPNGLMPAPPHDATGHTWHHSDEELFRITKFGMSAVVPNYESAMPAFGNALSDQEIQAILAFIKSTWPERERTYQQERSRP
ncbi:c-type cytochrome [Microvirga sp. GCM10011540]|uniref:c-type cytochrome n=1 Tax=Microvirga sp. GCM10011540 TaxID=3317338 RepID=UPI0036140305